MSEKPSENVRLVVTFGSGRSASVAMARDEAPAVLERIANGDPIVIQSHLRFDDGTMPLPFTTFVRGSAVTHAAVLPVMEADTDEERVKSTVPLGFHDPQTYPVRKGKGGRRSRARKQ